MQTNKPFGSIPTTLHEFDILFLWLIVLGGNEVLFAGTENFSRINVDDNHDK